MSNGYLSARFRFVEAAIERETQNAMPTATPLGRITINDRGETVSTVLGEFCTQVERLAHTAERDESLSEVLLFWHSSFVRYAVPYLQKKQAACDRAGRTKATAAFGRVIETIAHAVAVEEKIVAMNVCDPKTAGTVTKRAKVADFVLAQPADTFRATIVGALADEEASTLAMFASNAASDADGLRADVAETRAAVERTAAVVKDLAEDLSTWREWMRKLATNQKTKTPAPPLCAPMQTAIVRLWETFNAQPADCEDTTEPSGWRKHRRTYNECLLLHGNDDIWHGQKLKDLIPDAKALERVIHNAKEKERQNSAKQAAAKPPQACRKK